jgi:pimeloyl-ACP methyl ester carboxylesterase
MKKIIIALFALFLANFVSALNPVKEYAVTPADYGMDYKEITIQTEDGLELYGWMFKPNQNSNKIMIISHDGNGNMSDMLEQVSNFISLGYYVITYDYRGYGKSAAFTINNKFYIYSQFQKDLKAVYSYVKKYHDNLTKIHMYGVGIGAGLSLAVGANMGLGLIIADSPYSTLEAIKTKIKEVKNEDVMLPLGFNKTELEPKYALEAKGGLVGKIMMIAGDDDPVYTPKDIKELAKSDPDGSTVFVVKGATSETTFTKDKAKYFEEIKSFCN